MPRPDQQNNAGVADYLDRVNATDRAGWPTATRGGLDQRRASQTHYPVASIIAAAFEPLSVDLPAPLAGTHWIVSYISAIGVFANPPALPFQGPTVGLFLVRDGATVESLGDGQSTLGWVPERRGLVIPVRLDITPIAPGPGNKYAFACMALLPLPLTVTPGMTLRFLANINPGTLQPGPGVGSFATLRAVCTVERDQP